MHAPDSEFAGKSSSALVVFVFAAFIVIALGLSRRGLVMSWFPPGGADPAELGAAAPPAASRVRVILIDGLGLADAREIAALDRVCARGRDIVVDVGFPTVSLPVQHVLWTGLTQQQSGVLFSNAKLEPAPAFTMPAQVPSVAVAQSHGEIVRSFGFGEVLAPPDKQTDAAWEGDTFEATAGLMLHGEAPLAFVHVLAVDAAGHAHGRASSEYRDAAAHAGALLERWIPREIPDDEVWLWLADHGHGDVGGHGGAEPSIRRVRACIMAGTGIDPATPESVRLVDVAASLAHWLGAALPVAAHGVSMHALRASPSDDLPGPGVVRWLLGGLLVVGGLLVGRRASGNAWLLPWWFLLGYASFVALHGVPSLSLPPVFPPYGKAALLATLPGGLFALVACSVAVERGHAPRSVLLALLAAPIATWIAVVLASGTVTAWWTGSGPALVPYWSAHASVLASLLQCGVVGSALGVAIAAIRPQRR